MSNTFFQGGENFSKGGEAPLLTGLVSTLCSLVQYEIPFIFHVLHTEQELYNAKASFKSYLFNLHKCAIAVTTDALVGTTSIISNSKNTESVLAKED